MAESNFVDYVKILCRSGKGGRGSMHLKHVKYNYNGGPDGGDGGKGGDVVFVAAAKLTTLQAFRFKHKFVAPDGAKGMNRKMYGRGGEDLKIAVPVGTVIKDADTGKIVADFTEDGQEEVVCVGGKGGLGGWLRPGKRGRGGDLPGAEDLQICGRDAEDLKRSCRLFP